MKVLSFKIKSYWTWKLLPFFLAIWVISTANIPDKFMLWEGENIKLPTKMIHALNISLQILNFIEFLYFFFSNP